MRFLHTINRIKQETLYQCSKVIRNVSILLCSLQWTQWNLLTTGSFRIEFCLEQSDSGYPAFCHCSVYSASFDTKFCLRIRQIIICCQAFCLKGVPLWWLMNWFILQKEYSRVSRLFTQMLKTHSKEPGLTHFHNQHKSNMALIISYHCIDRFCEF